MTITRQQMITYLNNWLDSYGQIVPPDNNAFVMQTAIRAELMRVDERTLPELPEGWMIKELAQSYLAGTWYCDLYGVNKPTICLSEAEETLTPRAAVEAAIAKINQVKL